MSSCRIEFVGKSRNGSDRYWCLAHGASATGKWGARLDQCGKAGTEIVLKDCFEIDCSKFIGGIGIWGALPPAYNTAKEECPRGVHVHARENSQDDDKVIDSTFPAILLTYQSDLFNLKQEMVTAEAAVNYFVSRLLSRKLKALRCPHCQTLHLDTDVFATTEHRKHLCNQCGRHYSDHEPSISNPLVFLKNQLGQEKGSREFSKAPRSLDIKQTDFPGGVQVWASNPAIIWTVPRPEETGVHVHLFGPDGTVRVEDDTFCSVRIDDLEIEEEPLRVYMAQQSLKFLEDRIVSLICGACGKLHFDRGGMAFRPHSIHRCEHCGKAIVDGRRKKTVSNPMHAVLDQLKRNIAPRKGAI